MTIGEKIKTARIAQNKTQSDVVQDKITRNMLSAIEGDKALPSLDTLLYLSRELDLPISYLLSNETDISVYRKQDMIDDIKDAFSSGKYSDCISLIEKIGKVDDELAYILCYSNFHLGTAAAKFGSFITADKYLAASLEYAKSTIYDTKSIECAIPLYLAFVKNVNSPLLDFDKPQYLQSMAETVDYEFFKYLCNDASYNYSNLLFKKHLQAKVKMRERKYYDAIHLLLEITESRTSVEYNAYLMYGVYGDLDNCYKQVCDFENAYKYSSKRISMLESFNS